MSLTCGVCSVKVDSYSGPFPDGKWRCETCVIFAPYRTEAELAWIEKRTLELMEISRRAGPRSLPPARAGGCQDRPIPKKIQKQRDDMLYKHCRMQADDEMAEAIASL